MRLKKYYKNHLRNFIIINFNIITLKQITQLVNLKLQMDIKKCFKPIQINLINFVQLITQKFLKKTNIKDLLQNIFCFFSIFKSFQFLNSFVSTYLPYHFRKPKYLNQNISSNYINLFLKNFYNKYDNFLDLYGDLKLVNLASHLILTFNFSLKKNIQNIFILQNLQIPI